MLWETWTALYSLPGSLHMMFTVGLQGRHRNGCSFWLGCVCDLRAQYLHSGLRAESPAAPSLWVNSRRGTRPPCAFLDSAEATGSVYASQLWDVDLDFSLSYQSDCSSSS